MNEARKALLYAAGAMSLYAGYQSYNAQQEAWARTEQEAWARTEHENWPRAKHEDRARKEQEACARKEQEAWARAEQAMVDYKIESEPLKSSEAARRLGVARARGLRVLQIDGGGSMGLIPTIILLEIEQELARRLEKPVFLADHFDLVCGTSAGGMISIAHAHTRIRLLAIEELFASGAVFSSTLTTVGAVKNTMSRYSATRLNEFLTKHIGTEPLAGGSKEYQQRARERLGDPEEEAAKAKRPRVFVIANPSNSPDLYMFANYGVDEYTRFATKDLKLPLLRGDVPSNLAVRATSAAPTYLPPALVPAPGSAVADVEFRDGGLVNNSPVGHAVVQAKMLFGATRSLDLLISLGCGRDGSDKVQTPPAEPSFWRSWLASPFASTYGIDLDPTLDVAKRLAADVMRAVTNSEKEYEQALRHLSVEPRMANAVRSNVRRINPTYQELDVQNEKDMDTERPHARVKTKELVGMTQSDPKLLAELAKRVHALYDPDGKKHAEIQYVVDILMEDVEAAVKSEDPAVALLPVMIRGRLDFANPPTVKELEQHRRRSLDAARFLPPALVSAKHTLSWKLHLAVLSLDPKVKQAIDEIEAKQEQDKKKAAEEAKKAIEEATEEDKKAAKKAIEEAAEKAKKAKRDAFALEVDERRSIVRSSEQWAGVAKSCVPILAFLLRARQVLTPEEWAREMASSNPSNLAMEIEEARFSLTRDFLFAMLEDAKAQAEKEKQPNVLGFAEKEAQSSILGFVKEVAESGPGVDAFLAMIRIGLELDRANALYNMKAVRSDPMCPRGIPWNNKEQHDDVKSRLLARLVETHRAALSKFVKKHRPSINGEYVSLFAAEGFDEGTEELAGRIRVAMEELMAYAEPDWLGPGSGEE